MADGHDQAMKIYLINLDRSPERLALMDGAFSGIGVEFTRVQAVDGKLLPTGAESPIPKRPGQFYQLGAGETACFLSHQKCWHAAAAGDAEYSAIFEDDAHFGESAGELLRTTSWIPKDADIVKLETTLVRTLFDKLPATGFGSRHVNRLRGTHGGTCGYVVSRQAARKLIAASEGFVDPVDQYMFNTGSAVWPSLKIYQLTPAVCIQDMFLEGGSVVSTLVSTLGQERPITNRRDGRTKLFKEAARPLNRLGKLLVSKIRGHEWKRVPFR